MIKGMKMNEVDMDYGFDVIKMRGKSKDQTDIVAHFSDYESAIQYTEAHRNTIVRYYRKKDA